MADLLGDINETICLLSAWRDRLVSLGDTTRLDEAHMNELSEAKSKLTLTEIGVLASLPTSAGVGVFTLKH